jgi:hypothetical protein
MAAGGREAQPKPNVKCLDPTPVSDPNSKCVFVPSGFSVSHVSLLIATPQKSRSSRSSDDPRGAQNSFANELPAVHIPV